MIYTEAEDYLDHQFHLSTLERCDRPDFLLLLFLVASTPGKDSHPVSVSLAEAFANAGRILFASEFPEPCHSSIRISFSDACYIGPSHP